MIIMEKKAIFCGSQSVIFNAHSYIKEFIEKSKEDPLFIENLNSEEKEKYRNDFKLIDDINGLSEEEQKYDELLNS